MTKDEQYRQNLTRLACAELFSLVSMTASREMYGKSYFSLGAAEKAALDQTVLSSISANYFALVPEWFGDANPVQKGFQPPDNQPESS
jgi:hypothetical protein